MVDPVEPRQEGVALPLLDQRAGELLGPDQTGLRAEVDDLSVYDLLLRVRG
ncbi:hypothetical protein AB0K48_02290 [Nonomuraea sp. NPDC055795]